MEGRAQRSEEGLRESLAGEDQGQGVGARLRGASPPAHDESIWQEAEAEEMDREEMRARAIAITRGLLPRLGQRNVQSVMEYVLEVIEAEPERIEIPNDELADALGLTVDVAKKSKSRGFQRLERIVKEEGLAEEGFSFSELVPIDPEDEEG